MILKRFLALAWIVAVPLAAQTEDALRRFFEGRSVRVKIDLPGTKDGMDIYWRKDPPANMQSYGQRMRAFGPALRAGDSVAVTTLRVKGKNIEFQLGGGGYGVAGDDSGYVIAPSLPKSNREVELEKQLSKEPDSDRRDHMKRDLARLRDERDAEQRRLRERARELEIRKQQEIANLRMQAGSRFNIWFPDGYLRESVPNPRELMQILGPWVEFSSTSGAPVNEPAPPPDPASAGGNFASPTRITRGMTIEQVHSILGRPGSFHEGKQGDLPTLTESWETAEERVEVLFVGGVVVKYSTSSR